MHVDDSVTLKLHRKQPMSSVEVGECRLPVAVAKACAQLVIITLSVKKV
jgi:hypothetical protein